uniref:Uncharacterized protein n=1 Tax=Arundo donax TaxID=35708 RepID=A0A0A9BWA9_ARUDO
MWRRGKTR